MAAITDLAAAASVAPADLFVINQSGTDKKIAFSNVVTFGTFTATLVCGTSGTVTLDASYNTCSYCKIGRFVMVQGQLSVSSVSSPTGRLMFTGLPFTLASETEGGEFFSGSVYNYGPVADLMNISYSVGDDRPNIRYWTGTAWADAAGRVTAGDGFVIQFCYLAAS